MVEKEVDKKKVKTSGRMELKEINGNLFSVHKKYYLAHCISRDFEPNSNMEIEFQKRFKLRKRLKEHDGISKDNCILIGRVFNLITREPEQSRTTYASIVRAIKSLRELILEENVKYLAMPKIGCGPLEGLKWNLVKVIIYDILGDLDIDIYVYYTD